MTEKDKCTHPFNPVYDKNSKILILGSFPSETSKEKGFYYGDDGNTFWKVLAEAIGKQEPKLADNEKDDDYKKIKAKRKAFLLENNIALYDAIYRCNKSDRSKDSGITDIEPSNIYDILKETSITQVFCGGRLAQRVAKKEIKRINKEEGKNYPCPIYLPSTSARNTRYKNRLVEMWSKTIKNPPDSSREPCK